MIKVIQATASELELVVDMGILFAGELVGKQGFRLHTEPTYRNFIGQQV